MMTTVNGRVDDPDAWMTGIGNDVYRDIDSRYEGFDTVLVGRTTYAEMYAYWPNAEIEDVAARRPARCPDMWRASTRRSTGAWPTR